MKTEIGFISGVGIFYPGELPKIKKKDETPLQPLYEAFTNSLEAINLLKDKDALNGTGRISISIYRVDNLTSPADNKFDFHKIVVEDNGIGFTDSEFERFINLHDNRKNFFNKGTGRIQFIHSFDTTTITSIFSEGSEDNFRYRKITLSKRDAFLKVNAIIRLDKEEKANSTERTTQVIFEGLLNEKENAIYSALEPNELKRLIIRHYLARFCESRDFLPEIVIKLFTNGIEEDKTQITDSDIPIPEKEDPIEVNFSRIENNTIERSSKTEKFILKSFKIPEQELTKNGLKLVSKGEIAKEIHLDNLLPNEQIDGYRYLFLLSGKYINEKDSDTRGDINILYKKDLKKLFQNELFPQEVITLDDLEESTNRYITNTFQEIGIRHLDKLKSIEELKKMFLLNPNTLKSLQGKIHIDDSDEVILRKVYEAEAKNVALKDAALKANIEKLKRLDTKNLDYQSDLKSMVDEFVQEIPLQNRTALTQYVARRQLVLDLFSMILDKEILKLKQGARIDEDVLHNLIFQQSTTDPESSDLWIINEDFIYFKGFSEYRLDSILVDGRKLFKEEFTKEEERYLRSLGENRLSKRPDVLLFPEEGKCILIEFKAPDVNVAEHLSQIDFYSNLIRNYTIDEIQITTFYGYLIGEAIEDRDVRGRVTRFEHSYNFDYWFRPSENVTGFDRTNGNIYTEVIKYSSLLQRAKARNRIFKDKLGINTIS